MGKIQTIRKLTSASLYLAWNLKLLENVEHCGGEPEQAATMATHE